MTTPSSLVLRPLEAADAEPIAAAFRALGWDKPASQYARYLAEQNEGRRAVLVALLNGTFAGYLTVNWHSEYPPFRQENVPEIQDFNVLPPYRRQGIGTRLMDAAERLIAARAPVAGIGVGLYADYGPAQRLYVLRGYVPDGRGVTYDNVPVRPGESTRADDSLVLHLTKWLAAIV